MLKGRNGMGPLVLAVWALFGAVGAQAQVLDGPQAVFRLETKHFTILFTAPSRATATRLQALAEDVYDEVSSALSAPLEVHLPVVIAAGHDDLNGFFTPFPAARIVLYEAPLSPNAGFAVYDDVLRKLFLHELTHAVTLLQKDPFHAFLSALLGDVASPAMVEAPASFIEGSAVSFESRNGFGRATDSAVAAVIQQAILENRFPTFIEAAGAKDGYPPGIWYTYGAWFSRYLQDTAGMEKYAAFWKLLGSGQGIYDWLWFSGAFRTVYGSDLDAEWIRFREWMRPKAPVYAPGPFVDDGFGLIAATSSHGNRIWVARNGGVYRTDRTDEAFGPLVYEFPADASVTRLDSSADGRLLLVSQSRLTATSGTAWRLRVWDTEKHSFAAVSWPEHLSEAAWSSDGTIVAVRSRGYTLDLVRVGPDGTEVLVAGSRNAIPSQPCPQADGSLLFLLQLNGKNRLARLDGAGKVQVLEAEELGNVRMLSSDGSRSWFTWDSDRTFPKLGVLQGRTLYLYPPVSGGVQLPVAVGSTVVYRGDFAEGQRLVQTVPGVPQVAEGNWQALELPVDGEDVPAAGAPYEPFWASLVPGVRYPLLKLDLGGPKLVHGAGVGFLSGDPTGYFNWNGSAQWLWAEGFVDAGLGLSLGNLPLDIGFQLADTDALRDGPNRTDVRRSSAMVTVSKTLALDVMDETVTAVLQTGAQAEAPSDGTLRPYGWAWNGVSVPLSARLGYQHRSDDRIAHTRAGWAASLGADGDIDPKTSPWPWGAAQLQTELWLPWGQLHLAPRLIVPLEAGQTLVPGGVVSRSGFSWSRNALWRVPSFFEDRSDLTGAALMMVEADTGWRLTVATGAGNLFYLPSLEFRAGYQGLGLVSSGGGAPGEWLSSLNGVAAATVVWTQIPVLESLNLSVGVRVDVPLSGSRSPDPVPSLWLQAGTLY